MTATADTAPVSQPFQAEVAELLHAPVAKWHYTNCSRNSRPTILAAR